MITEQDLKWNRVVFYSLNGQNVRSKGIRIDHYSYSDFIEKLHIRVSVPTGLNLSLCQGGLKEVNENNYEALENGSIIRVISDEPLEIRDSEAPLKPVAIGPMLQFINCKSFGPLSCEMSVDVNVPPWNSLATALFSEGSLLVHTGANYYKPIINLFQEKGLISAFTLSTAGFAEPLNDAKIHHTRAYRLQLDGWDEGSRMEMYLQVSPEQDKFSVFIEQEGLVDQTIQKERQELLQAQRLPLVMDIDGTIIKNPGNLEADIEFRPHFLDVVHDLAPLFEILLFSCGIPKHIQRVAEKINTEVGWELIPQSRLVSTTDVNWERRRKEKRLEFVYSFCVAGDPSTWDLPLIVDDKPVAWEKKQRGNVIEVQEYFGGQEQDQTWLQMKDVLSEVHSEFFRQYNSIQESTDDGISRPDVRKILARVKSMHELGGS